MSTTADEPGQDPDWSRPASERRRAEIGAFAGVVGASVFAWLVPWQATVLLTWLAGAGTVLVLTWIPLLRLDAAATRRLSTREDDSPTATRTLLVGAASASVIAVLFALADASNRPTGFQRALLTGASLASIAVAWLTIQTVYTLRYAHRYYTEPVGGIDFAGTADPDYHDFAYLAFTVGMTFQVSDTAIQSPAIRRVVLGQAILGYVFGAVIVAVAISLVANAVG